MDLREVSNNISNILLNLIIFLNLISKKFLTFKKEKKQKAKQKMDLKEIISTAL